MHSRARVRGLRRQQHVCIARTYTGEDQVKQPTTPDELLEVHKILSADPEKYLQIVTEWIREDPLDAGAYHSRYFGWMRTDRPDRAMDDINRAIEIDPRQGFLYARGMIFRQLGDYKSALQDFQQAESIDPIQWKGDAMGPYYQADCHARLGNVSDALALCTELPDDFWTPGLDGTPSGNKTQIAQELRRIAAEARANKA